MRQDWSGKLSANKTQYCYVIFDSGGIVWMLSLLMADAVRCTVAIAADDVDNDFATMLQYLVSCT
jgi:hypothetical protein